MALKRSSVRFRLAPPTLSLLFQGTNFRSDKRFETRLPMALRRVAVRGASGLRDDRHVPCALRSMQPGETRSRCLAPRDDLTKI